jgi:hypothetical protein
MGLRFVYASCHLFLMMVGRTPTWLHLRHITVAELPLLCNERTRQVRLALLQDGMIVVNDFVINPLSIFCGLQVTGCEIRLDVASQRLCHNMLPIIALCPHLLDTGFVLGCMQANTTHVVQDQHNRKQCYKAN